MWCKWIDFHTLWLWHVPVLDRSLIYIIFMKMYLCACHYVPSVCMRYLAPGATTWQKLGSCHLTADMTCATGHAAALLQCDTTCDYDGLCLLLLSDVRAEETSGGRCESAPWVEVGASPGIGGAATTGCDMSGGCHQPRKVCSCEAALKETAFIISLLSIIPLLSLRGPRTRNTSATCPALVSSQTRVAALHLLCEEGKQAQDVLMPAYWP